MHQHEKFPGATRAWFQRTAKSLGLPAIGPTEEIARRCRIVTSDPRTWSREDFDLILPYLAVHQDVRSCGDVTAILREGLARGMVDPASGLEPSGRQWTWARSYLGVDAYVFISAGLTFLSRGNPCLAPGNAPLFHAKPALDGSLWDAIRRGSITMLGTT